MQYSKTWSLLGQLKKLMRLVLKEEFKERR